jgi:hypothetical protein
MSHRIGGSVMLLALAVCLVSCSDLSTGRHDRTQVELEMLPPGNGVPAGWGPLISVTAVDDNSAVLWFENEQGEIHTVRYFVRRKILGPSARVIRRTESQIVATPPQAGPGATH